MAVRRSNRSSLARNLVERIDARGRAEPVAANVDRLVIVLAPRARAGFVPRRSLLGRRPAEGPRAAPDGQQIGLGRAIPCAASSDAYRELGLPCCEVSALGQPGLEALRAALAGGTTLLVGQSGVGKSSLINGSLLRRRRRPGSSCAMTRAATPPPPRGAIGCGPDCAVIDAPGVRDFAPPASLARAAERGFVEVHRSPPAAASTTAVTCRSRAARCAAPCSQGRSPRAATRATGGCSGCTRNSRPERLTHDAGAAGERVRQRAAVDVFELAADRHAVGDARCLDARARASSPR